MIDEAVRAAACGVEGLGEDFDPQVRPADPRFGDFQANGVLPHAKRTRANPRALGTALVEALHASGGLSGDEVSFELAGPGFINFRLSPAFMDAWLTRFGSEAEFRRAAGSLRGGERVVVDFSSPNTAKEMHVGHIRSTVIGEAVSRILEFCGAEVTRDNHLGDWGTQFGMIIWAIKREGFDLDAPGADPVAELERLYKLGNAAYKESAENADAIRAELVKLQRGDEENLRIWQRISEVSLAAFQKVYDRLGVRFDEVLGESYYRDKVEAVWRELEAEAIAEESEGALVVFHPEHPRFQKQPFIIRKADGASNYATTDLATVADRVKRLAPDEILYVVDARQSDHFEQLFLTVGKWFAKTGRKLPRLRHLSFGTVLGEDGRPIKTKEGGSVKLKDLLREATVRARGVVDEKAPDFPEDERAAIAECVGIGAVQYADLAQNRSSDYVFSWERVLSLEGNTAPYLLYAVARIHSIFRKAGENAAEAFADASPLETDRELSLARKLIGLPSALEQTLADYRPHVLCGYLYELAGEFSGFYNAEKVIVDDAAVRARRLRLCARTLAVLETGLHLLGLRTLPRM